MLPRLVLLAGWAFHAVAARPVFTNTNFDVEQGTPFTLHYQGCDDGCTIALMTGDSADLSVEEELTTSATGDSFTFTLSDLDAGTYAFRITSGSDSSYSALFELDGDSDSSESETAASSETPAESTTASESKSTSTSTSTSTSSASRSSITDSESSIDSQTTTTSTSSGVSSTISTASQATTTAPNPPKHGLSAGAIAGIVVGVVAVILIILGALFFWMRRRKQKAAKGSTSSTDPRDSQPQIGELEQPKNVDIVVTPATPAEMHGSTPPPPAAELTGQGRVPELPSTEKATSKELEGDVAAIAPELQGEEKELEGDVARTVPELHGEDKALPAELPGETARKDNEEQQKQSSVLPPIELPSSTQEPQEKETETPSVAQTQPNASASALPKSPSDAGSSPFTEGISPVSPVSDEASHSMLMEQYAQLEARRQRILELKTIEEEQAALRARLSKMQGGNGTE